MDTIDYLIRDLCEIPDRNSPDDQPEMLLVTAAEIRTAIERWIPAVPTTKDAERYRKLRDEENWGDDGAAGGGSRWTILGELSGAAFDAFVDAMPLTRKQEGDSMKPETPTKTELRDEIARLNLELQKRDKCSFMGPMRDCPTHGDKDAKRFRWLLERWWFGNDSGVDFGSALTEDEVRATIDAAMLKTPNAIGQGSAACGASPAPTGCASSGTNNERTDK